MENCYLELNKMQSEKKRYDLIDLTKFIGSIMIFTMHINAFADTESIRFIQELLSRWGVPFFFITSSYFLFSKSSNGNIDDKILKKYLKRIAFLYTTYFIFNLPDIAYFHFISSKYKAFSTIFHFLKSCILSSSFTGSWYLISCIVCSTLVYHLSKRFNTKHIILLSSVIQIICILCSAYNGLLPDNSIKVLISFLMFPNNCLGGLFYFSIGKFLFENKDKVKELSVKVLLCIFAISYILYFIEIYIAKHNNYLGMTDEGIFIIPTSVSLVIILLKFENRKIQNHIILRKISTILYCGQGNILVVCGVFRNVSHCSYLIKFFVGIICSILLILVVLWIQKSDKIKWAKYLT